MRWDFTGNKNTRFSNPELWKDMCEKRYISDVLKDELIYRESLFGHEDKIEWALMIITEGDDTHCCLEAFVEGLAYRHGGVAWNYIGSAAVEKKTNRYRIVRARPQPFSVEDLIH